MQKEISEQQFWEAYDAASAELQNAIFSEETAKIIFNACVENKVEDERISQIAQSVGDVLLGFLSPEQLQPTLELDLNLEPQTAENICQIIYDSVFEPVRPQLAELYLQGKKENNGSKEKEGEGTKIKVQLKTEKTLPKTSLDIDSKKTDKNDSYRESIG